MKKITLYIILMIINYQSYAVITDKENMVDKTSLIKAIADDQNKLLLITRPAGWGKSSNLRDIELFFSPNLRSDCSTNERLTTYKMRNMSDTAISAYPEIIDQYFGKYPTIFLSLKNIKADNIEELHKQISKRIHKLYQKYKYIGNSQALNIQELDLYKKYADDKIMLSKNEMEHSLRFLEDMMNKHFNLPTIILIDEYDNLVKLWYSKQFKANNNFPEPDAYLNEVYDLIGNLIGNALGNNDSLHKAVIIGVTNVSEMKLLSAARTYRLDSLLDPYLGEFFGFTEEEVAQLFKDAGIWTNEKIRNNIREWYGGYKIGGKEIYNPPSVMLTIDEYKKKKDIFVSHMRYISMKAEFTTEKRRKELEILLSGGSINIVANPNAGFKDRHSKTDDFYSLLLFQGYLTAENIVKKPNGTYNCDVRIPNKEYMEVFGGAKK